MDLELMKFYESSMYELLRDIHQNLDRQVIINKYDHLFYYGNEKRIEKLWNDRLLREDFYDKHISTAFEIYWAFLENNTKFYYYEKINTASGLATVLQSIKICFEMLWEAET